MTSISVHMRLTFLKYFIIRIMVGFIISMTNISVFAHEPIFGLGPHTIFKGGIGLETEIERESASNSNEKEKDLVLHNEIIYGLTEDLAVTLALSYVLDRNLDAEGIGKSSSGLSDTSLRLKYRFWRRDRPGIQDAAAFIIGIKFPTGDADKSPRLGSGSTDFLLGLAAGRESLLWYYFGDIRYRVNTKGSSGLKVGDRFFADVAIGIRPWPAEYLKPDLVVLAELNWETLMRNELDGLDVSNSGGNLLFLSPSFFLTYRNWAVKGGVQIPLYQNLYGNQPGEDYRFKLAVEIHF
jgi:hypothetical protein